MYFTVRSRVSTKRSGTRRLEKAEAMEDQGVVPERRAAASTARSILAPR